PPIVVEGRVVPWAPAKAPVALVKDPAPEASSKPTEVKEAEKMATMTPAELINAQREAGQDEGKYQNWTKVTTALGEESKLVNPWIASRAEKSAKAAEVALKMLREGLAALPPKESYEKYFRAQEEAKLHAVGDNIFRRLRRKIRLEL